MPESGYLTLRVYQSHAQLPLYGAAITVTQPASSGSHLLATRLTDQSGKAGPITIETPNRSESQIPGFPRPFTAVDVTAEYPGYERILVENVQIFSGIETQQNLEMLPLSARPDAFNMTEIFDISAQQL